MRATIFVCPLSHRPYAIKDGHVLDMVRWAPFDEDKLVATKVVLCTGCLPAGVYDTEEAEDLLVKQPISKISPLNNSPTALYR